MLWHHVQFSSEDALHLTSCGPVLSAHAAVDSIKLHLCVALILLDFFLFPNLILTILPQPPPKPSCLSLEVRQLFVDQLALLKQHSYTNTWGLVCL